jgi:hypothetical protein
VKRRKTKIVELNDNSIVVVQLKGVVSVEQQETIIENMKGYLGQDKIILVEDDVVKYKFVERKTNDADIQQIKSKLNEIISYLYENRH